MISVSNLTLHFGERPMFDEVSFFIGKDDRIGLVGRNGAGLSNARRADIPGNVPCTFGTRQA